jgi:hypothetical protein
MVKIYDQISLFQSYQECKDTYQNNKPKFLELLSKYLDLSTIIPITFYYSYYKHLGRNREISLHSMLAALLLQKILGIPTITLLINILILSKNIREFCGFTKVPDNSQFTRFKQDHETDLEDFFDKLVDMTEPICRAIDSELASVIAFDTSGIEPYVTENNPKYLNKIIKQLKNTCKDKSEDDIYKIAYSLLPSHAFTNEEIKQLYINGHFCYAYKFAIMTNGLGIPRNITFLDDDFKSKHPEMPFKKKTDSPEEDKSIADIKALKPVLDDYYKKHPDHKYSTFLGDSIFDSYDTYEMLMDDFKFSKVLIPLNPRNSNTEIPPVEYNEFGWPLCTKDPSLTMKPAGWAREEGRPDRFQWRCPKVKRINGKWITSCDDPCNGKDCGRVTYTFPQQERRMYPGIIRDSEEWIEGYKLRSVVEKNIEYIKEPLSCGSLKTQNKKTIKADLYLAGITQLLTLIVAYNMHKHEYIRSLRPLIRTA